MAGAAATADRTPQTRAAVGYHYHPTIYSFLNVREASRFYRTHKAVRPEISEKVNLLARQLIDTFGFSSLTVEDNGFHTLHKCVIQLRRKAGTASGLLKAGNIPLDPAAAIRYLEPIVYNNDYDLKKLWSRLWGQLEDLETKPALDAPASTIRSWMQLRDNSIHLSRIQVLDLSHLDLSTVPYEIRFLFNLTNLNLSNNFIDVIHPNALRGCQWLESLDLSHNCINMISLSGFSELDQLVTLQLSYNVIKRLANETFSPVRGLRELDLSHNDIIDLGVTMHSLPRLITLDLAHNKLRVIYPNTFIFYASPQKLDISYNEIERIGDGAFDNMINEYTFENDLVEIKFDHHGTAKVPKELYELNQTCASEWCDVCCYCVQIFITLGVLISLVTWFLPPPPNDYYPT